ncbi:rplJ [Wigglesworthia glossinidia endosymbiont of Glossina brevipalpis]|uniref:Large ribosomal subunit protein uL10 n=1 Tax=Wigglesworthia glossinidia brevipalpis TaxID=36870 RepID=RL10_WIGBR|nr:RecName: Full=Large ribosomal subunit protein uL10; AltName: Full=50S ribosomal protein L10 [Wigglesworthia glossinidia endosymbiont of Glossina brevipalpis]BAC24666.1 rplJ [Wigglesworthia glossinidia endosymbiont of Glossina brevipalpis]
MLNRKNKENIISKINKITKSSLSILIVDPTGITSNQMNNLRKSSRKLNVNIKQVRNTLMRFAIVDTEFDCLEKYIKGSNLIAFSHSHPGSAARIFKNFTKENNKIKIKLAVFERKIITDSNIDYLANLPTHEESVINFINIIQEASIKKLIRILILINNNK